MMDQGSAAVALGQTRGHDTAPLFDRLLCLRANLSDMSTQLHAFEQRMNGRLPEPPSSAAINSSKQTGAEPVMSIEDVVSQIEQHAIDIASVHHRIASRF